MGNLGSVTMALFGFSLQAFGGVLQKKGSLWMGWKDKKNRQYFIALFIWILGILVFNISVIPIGIASKTLLPHIVSGISGWSIAVIVISSYFFLKEKLYWTDLFYSSLIIISIFLFGILHIATKIDTINTFALYTLIVLPFVALIPCFIKNAAVKTKAILFATFSGLSSGLAIVLMNVTVKVSENSIYSYLKNPYLYMYVIVGLLALVAIQFAYKHGAIILVGPFQTSCSIIYPAICSYFVFNSPIRYSQIFILIIILFSCISMLRKHFNSL